MNTTYTKEVSIHADQATTWEAINQTRFVKDFLPEVQKDTDGFGEYVRQTHRRIDQVGPDYVAPGHAMGWSAGAGTAIRLVRKDVEANIESVDIQVEGQGEYTKVRIEVNYNPEFGNRYFLARRCVRGLFGFKLDILKKDLETNNKIDWVPAFA